MITEKFLPVLKSGGMTLAPFNAWVVLKGLETLDLRMRAQTARAQILAEWLEQSTPLWRVCTTPACAATRNTIWPCAKCRAWAARCCRSM